MKIYFNREPVAGPWGGGSKILRTIVDACAQAGHHVTFSRESGIDVVFCMDPRPGASGTFEDLLKMGAPIVQRVGDVGSHGKPELSLLLLKTLPHAARVIYPSAWAMAQTGVRGIIIPNAPIRDFYAYRSDRVVPSRPIRVVTHHWSNNPKKGFALYREFIDRTRLMDIEFTFIGRSDGSIPSIGVMDASELAQELPKHDIYLTASEEEAGANHVLEAMAVGLPVAYSVLGGSIVEYCHSGLGFTSPTEAVSVVTHIANNYAQFKGQVVKYTRTMDEQAKEYVSILEGFAR